MDSSEPIQTTAGILNVNNFSRFFNFRNDCLENEVRNWLETQESGTSYLLFADLIISKDSPHELLWLNLGAT